MPTRRPSALRPSAKSPSANLLAGLETRFAAHPQRHVGIDWTDVAARLSDHPEKLRSLEAMESTGGEPDVIGRDARTGEILFADCSPQSPAGRVSGCYDREGLESRKEHKPAHNAVDLAASMGVELMDEAQYRDLQRLGEFDTKSSSWLKTPPEIRELGGALFGDRRYGRVFTYHNGAQSYYSGRAFRGLLRV